MGPELSLRYDEALRWPVTKWRQCGGRVRLEGASEVAAWIRRLSLSGALGPRPSCLPGPIMGFGGRTA